MKIFLLKFLKGEINPLINFLIFLITFIIFIGILSLLFELHIADQNSLRLIFYLYGIYSLLSVYISLKSIFITIKKNKNWDKILSITIFLLMVTNLIILLDSKLLI